MEMLLKKLLEVLTEPSQLILLLWVLWLILDRKDDRKIIADLLLAQQERSVTNTKIIMMIEQLVRDSSRGKSHD